jgi:peptide-methionine (S)-S-oxide reductase
MILSLRHHPTGARFTAMMILTLGLVVASCTAQKPETTSTPGAPTVTDSADSKKQAVATFAGGCFWCTEAVFERMNGVGEVVSGYIGGRMPDPDYNAVCTGTTGHAEAVEIYYDPSVTTYEDLLDVFFKTHDPTTLNRQGADVGTQYRSAIFFHDDDEKARAEAYIKKLNASGEFRSPVVTTLEPASKFYTAEEYHQDYFARNPNAGYCQAVVRSKVKKFDEHFSDKRKADVPANGN